MLPEQSEKDSKLLHDQQRKALLLIKKKKKKVLAAKYIQGASLKLPAMMDSPWSAWNFPCPEMTSHKHAPVKHGVLHTPRVHPCWADCSPWHKSMWIGARALSSQTAPDGAVVAEYFGWGFTEASLRLPKKLLIINSSRHMFSCNQSIDL